jgi:hypothetical protein
MMEENLEDCSWEEVYKLNGVILNGDERFSELDIEDIDTIVVGYSSPLKPIVKFDISEIVLSR